jgi:hypothetical protein
LARFTCACYAFFPILFGLGGLVCGCFARRGWRVSSAPRCPWATARLPVRTGFWVSCYLDIVLAAARVESIRVMSMNVAEWGKELTESLADGPGAPALLTLAPCGDATASDEVVLTEVAQDHPHGTLTLILGVPLGHNRYPSQKKKRHQTRYGSLTE